MPIHFADRLEDAHAFLRRLDYDALARTPEHPDAVGTPPTPEVIATNEQTRRRMALVRRAPMFGAALSATFLGLRVLPLEPGGTTPMVDAKHATRDEQQLFAWWSETPTANPGFITRGSGILVVEVARGVGPDALRDLARVELYDPEEGVRALRFRDLGAMFRMQLSAPPGPPIRWSPTAWGSQGIAKASQPYGDQAGRPDSWFYLWRSERTFKAHQVGAGVRVVGPDEVLPWRASRIGGKVMASMGVEPERLPDFLADVFAQGPVRTAARRATKPTTQQLVTSGAPNPHDAVWGDDEG